MNLNKQYDLIEGINKIIISANREQKDAKTYDEMRVQSGVIAACVDSKYKIENGEYRNLANLKEHIDYDYDTYKEMVEKALDEDPWKRYYRGKVKGYKMIAELLSEGVYGK